MKKKRFNGDNAALIAWAAAVVLILSGIFYQGVCARTGAPIYEGINLFPVEAGATPTASGQAKYDSGTSLIVVGDGSKARAYPSAQPWRVTIASPEAQPSPRAIIIPPADNGLTYYVVGATFWATQSGCSIAGVSRTAAKGELGSTTWSLDQSTSLWTGINMSEGGISRYYVSFLAGVSPIPPGSALIINWGDASTADYAGFTFDGYWSTE